MVQDEQVNILALPDEVTLRRELAAVTKFQQIVHSQLVAGLDYGVIPGTQRPTLLKPGAEKVAKLMGLADEYEILDRQEDWDKPFFRYLIRCRLISIRVGICVSQGLGECNSMESKYRWRWLWPGDVPPGFDKAKAVSRTVRNGGKQYRVENDDIYTQVNTLVKMAKKRALVDAALSAGRLSDIFTQDIEDLRDAPTEEVEKKVPQVTMPVPSARGEKETVTEEDVKNPITTIMQEIEKSEPAGLPEPAGPPEPLPSTYVQLWNYGIALGWKTKREIMADLDVYNDASITDIPAAARRLWEIKHATK